MFHPFTGFSTRPSKKKKKQVIPPKSAGFVSTTNTSSGLLGPRLNAPHLVLPFPAAPLASQWRRRRPRATTEFAHWIIPQGEFNPYQNWVVSNKKGYIPQNVGWFISWNSLLKGMIWGYHYFWKHPYVWFLIIYIWMIFMAKRT